MLRTGLISAAFLGASGVFAADALAIDVPDYDFEWCVIGDAGNPGYHGWDPTRHPWIRVGNGSIGYVYRMTATETTTAQWVEYYNALAEHEPGIAWDERPWRWGARLVGTPLDPRWEVGSDPDDWRRGAVVPLRAAARLCNWLHNGKARERWAFMDGAYDATTFGYDNAFGDITDDYTRREGALFFIPSPEEWIKAVYYDPDRYGPGLGGWWTHPDMSDEILTPGLPGEPGAETGVGLIFPGFTGLDQPLMSYPQTRSAWGLMDASGVTSEWTDRFLIDDSWLGPHYMWVGSSGLYTPHPHFIEFPDHIVGTGGAEPERMHIETNLRVGSVVPCLPDFRAPFGVLDLRDVAGFIEAYIDGRPSADLESDGTVGPADVMLFVESFAAGCGGGVGSGGGGVTALR